MTYHTTHVPLKHDTTLEPTVADHKAHWQAFITRFRLGTPIAVGQEQFMRVIPPVLGLFPRNPTAHHHWRFLFAPPIISEPLVWVVVLDELGYPLGMA